MLTLNKLSDKRANSFLFALVFIFTLSFSESHSQDFLDEFDSLIEEENIDLLPEKMIFTQKWLWGEKGLLRKTGISELTLENREKELILREKLLKAHQILGYITFAGMIAQGIVGSKLYNGDYSLEDTHEAIGAFVNTTYFTGAGLSLFTPPPLVVALKRSRKRSLLDVSWWAGPKGVVGEAPTKIYGRAGWESRPQGFHQHPNQKVGGEFRGMA